MDFVLLRSQAGDWRALAICKFLTLTKTCRNRPRRNGNRPMRLLSPYTPWLILCNDWLEAKEEEECAGGRRRVCCSLAKPGTASRPRFCETADLQSQNVRN